MFVGNDFNCGGRAGRPTLYALQGGDNEASNIANLDESSIWSGGDFTYFLRQTIILGPNEISDDPGDGVIPPVPPATTLRTT